MSEEERAIVIGSLLGDAHLKLTTRSWSVQFLHSGTQKDYIFWKYKKLATLATQPPRSWKNFDVRYGKYYTSWKFQTHCSAETNELHSVFYPEGTKIIPCGIKDLLTHPIMLAVWYMDDGGRRKDCHGLFLNTLSFTELEQHILQECLEENFGMKTRIHWVGDGFRLYIPSSSAQEFCRIVGPYIIPSMQYKLSYDPVTTKSLGVWRKPRHR